VLLTVKNGLLRLTIASIIVYATNRYMQESGFVHASFTFLHESMLARTDLRTFDKTIPPGALLTFLQKGLQYIGVEESLRHQEGVSKKSTNKKPNPNVSSQQTSYNNGDIASSSNYGKITLLSQTAIASLTRKNPPIQLTVPPAAAAAAVKARLAFEAEVRQQQLLDQRDSFSHPSMDPPRIIEAPVPLNESSTNLNSYGVTTSPQPASRIARMNEVEDLNSRQQTALRTKDTALIARNNKVSDTTSVPIQMSSTQTDASELSNQIVSSKRSSFESKRKKQKTKNGEPIQALATADNNTNVLSGFSSLSEAASRLEAQLGRSDEVAGESDDPETRLIGPVHLGAQHSEGPTVQMMGVPSNGLFGESNRNGEVASRASAFQPIREHNGQHLPPAPMDNAGQHPLGAEHIQSDVLILSSHRSEVFMCAWNPVFTHLIATGSGDASARIWEMNGNTARSGLMSSTLLSHGIDQGDIRNRDVTTLEWSSDGKMLATGSYDGVARVWDRSGTLLYSLSGHQGPIFSLKWNKRGSFLLSGSYDKTIIVWNVSAGGGVGSIEHQFRDHQAPALDVDWKDNTVFASCSTDRTVHIYCIDVDAPLKVYEGHRDEVNAVKWDYSGRYLASCSDDCTAKVWDVESDRTDALFDFVSHDQEIYTVKWSPTGPGSPNPDKIPLLATASFDGSIRLWNITDGSCFRFFNQHVHSVYSVAFSPSGSYLASGSLAGQMYIWSIEENRHVKSYVGNGDIFEVAWNKEETRVAACFSSHVVAVIDFDASSLANTLTRI
jgi:WD40 repeat protein